MALHTNQHATVVGVFTDAHRAQQAVAELRQMGFREDQIGVIARDRQTVDAATETTTETGSNVATGAATGAAAGAGVGALWALGIAAGILPAIGPVIAGGLLASVLASAAGGAAVAGIVGALIGLGIPEEEAHYYEGEFRSGRVIVTVRADERYNEAWTILNRHGAYNRTSPLPAATAQRSAAGEIIKAGDEVCIPVREEQVRVEKGPPVREEERAGKTR